MYVLICVLCHTCGEKLAQSVVFLCRTLLLLYHQRSVSHMKVSGTAFSSSQPLAYAVHQTCGVIGMGSHGRSPDCLFLFSSSKRSQWVRPRLLLCSKYPLECDCFRLFRPSDSVFPTLPSSLSPLRSFNFHCVSVPPSVSEEYVSLLFPHSSYPSHFFPCLCG